MGSGGRAPQLRRDVNQTVTDIMRSNIQWIVFDLGGVVVKLNIDGALEALRFTPATRGKLEHF